MTINDVKEKVEEIRTRRYDDEVAHNLEDKLYREVLQEIAKGTANPNGLASAVLESRKLNFNRRCS